jgi:hypothetical protein
MTLAPILAALAILSAGRAEGDHVDLPSDARLFMPTAWAPRDGEVNVVLHLHGAPEVTEPAVAALGWNAVLVTFNRKGLSSAYAAPFSDPALLPRLLDETMKAATQRRPGGPYRLGRLVVSSFSAGFGGVREMLKQPSALDRVDAVVLADSLYCGYEGDPADRRLDDDLMSGFRCFARQAADGRKTMLVTHSAQIPPGYGGTTETADDLMATVGVVAEPVAADWGDGWRQTRSASRGRFVVLGFAGDGPEDHMRHLRRIRQVWRRLPDPLAATP